MHLEDFKNELYELMTDIPTVITRLSAVLSAQSPYANEVILIKGNYLNVETANRTTTITDDDFRVEKNKTAKSLRDIIQNLTANDLKSGNVSALERAIDELKLPPLGRLKLVDCDRTLPFDQFATFFTSHDKTPLQFYFITAPLSQQPANFAERLIYEVTQSIDDKTDQAVNFKHYQCEFTGIQRAEVEVFKFNKLMSLNTLQNQFLRNLSERVAHFNTDNLPPEDIIKLPKSRLPYRFFSFLYRIDAAQWNDTLTNFFMWLVEIFHTNETAAPTFQVIISVYSNTNNVEIAEKGIKSIIDAYPQPCIHIKNFEPLKKTELEDWFIEAAEGRLQPKARAIIGQFTDELKIKGTWDGVSGLNMADLEELFFTIYNVSQK